MLTVPQAEALWDAARYVLEQLLPGGDAPPAATQRALKNAQDKIGTALDARGEPGS
jgi:hypothetical protein